MSGYVYILRDANNKFYIGSTDNIERRLKAHSHGHSKTTKRMESPTLVLSQEYPSLIEARRIENRLKKMKRKDYIVKIVADGYIKIAE